MSHPLRTSNHSGKQPQPVAYPINFNNLNNYAKNIDLNGNNYYEDKNIGFYRIQNPYEPRQPVKLVQHHHQNFFSNRNNYEYTHSHQNDNQINNHAVVVLQEMKLNQMYQSEENLSENFAIVQPKSQLKFLSKSTLGIESTRQVNDKNDRRSYSNSKLDYQKWQRTLTKQPTYNHINIWSSKILSEHEQKKFLAQSSSSPVYRQKTKQQFTSLHGSSRLTTSWIQQETQQQHDLLKERRNNKCKSFSGLSQKINRNNSTDKNLQVISALMMNNRSRRVAKLNQEFSSIIFNSSEIDSVLANNKQQLRQRSSTFKAIDNFGGSQTTTQQKRNSALVRFGHKLKNLSTERMLVKTGSGFKTFENQDMQMDSANPDSANKLISSLFSVPQKRNSKYSRLCKSFTFLSMSSNVLQQAQNTANAYSSDPNKLSMSLKRNSNQSQINYLKNLSAFEREIELESLNLLVKKLENVTNLSVLLKNLAKSTKTYNDACVQTSQLIDSNSSQSSSFNSHGTTLMQTNCYGSIVGNFGSVMIQPSAKMISTEHVNVRKQNFLRSHSDGTGLSSDHEANELMMQRNKLNANISSLSSKVPTFIKRA
jgi:hypothetical protein